MSGLDRVDDVTARRFAADFERDFGIPLVGPDEAAGETRQLPATPFIERRLQADAAGLAEMLGVAVEELL